MSPQALGYDEPTPEERAEAEQAMARAAEAFARGRLVPPTLEGYRAAAARDPAAVIEALVTRAGTRWRNVRKSVGFAAALAMPRLNRLISIDAGLSELGFYYDVDKYPFLALAHEGVDWPSHVRSGADSVAAAARFLMLYQPIGAAAFLRGQMERWTNNRATTIGLDRHEGETHAHFIDRVWAGAWTMPIAPGGFYQELSELLHGRGRFAPLVIWEARDLAEWEMPDDASLPNIVLPMAGSLVLQQVTACVMDMARRAGRDDLATWLMDWPPSTDSPEQVMIDHLWLGLPPLMPYSLTAPFVSKLGAAEKAYLELLTETRTKPAWPGMTVLAFLVRRYRAGQGAIYSLKQEQERLGSDFDPRSLHGRDARYVLVGELAALIGQWVPGSAGEALTFAAAALRSAFAIWLEDDSRAMIPVRTMLENVARARTWRMKPARAAKLEARGPATSPRDWLAAAGWRRLGVFNAALGELSHSMYESRTHGALEVLATVQSPEAVVSDPLHTGRGEALDQTVFLLASESMAWLRELDPGLAAVVQAEARLPENFEPGIEEWMRRSWANRNCDFGGPSFRKLDLAELQEYGLSLDDIVLGRAAFRDDDLTEYEP